MFSTPKKAKIVSTSTPAEQKKVGRSMRKKYPQMYDENGNLKEEYMGRKLSENEKALRASGAGPDDMKTDEEKRAWRKNR